MKIKCPFCSNIPNCPTEVRENYVKNGSFYRISDRKRVQRYRCKLCTRFFSTAIFSKCYRQKKRQLNHKIARLLVAGVSQREGARLLKINRKSFVRKFVFMGEIAKANLVLWNQKLPKSTKVQFDDMETFEHTKCKPLSITLAIEEDTRRILHYEVSPMPAKGRLAQISLKKYGKREDRRSAARRKLLGELSKLVVPNSIFKSDENPHYPKDLREYFPESKHIQFKGRLATETGYGELKKGVYDPLFDLNHTCASMRARMSRLLRKTWCTTKKPERLELHLALAALHHNLNLKNLSSA